MATPSLPDELYALEACFSIFKLDASFSLGCAAGVTSGRRAKVLKTVGCTETDFFFRTAGQPVCADKYSSRFRTVCWLMLYFLRSSATGLPYLLASFLG